ncbi:MAG: MoaD/ThiS family protein [Planctomycetaceae bacterium]|nr:MoaD/ThiS family protein [Planctomycetaceae bacterium]
MIRVALPFHLRRLANVETEVTLNVEAPVTPGRILDALEQLYPVLKGTIRDHQTGARRPLLRFYACLEDFSHEPLDAPLPDAVAQGTEPFLIVGAVAGG